MCDTYSFKSNNTRFFGKNSDRSVNEPNLALYIKSSKKKDIEINATYIKVDHVNDLYDAFIIKPSWCYGAEIGVNEYGLSIGNEAVFTKGTKVNKKINRLIGMDMVRLALIGAKTARGGAILLIDLLKKYGQGGSCGYDKPFYYDNSFLLQDSKEAYILETAGYKYHITKIEGNDNISNRLNDYKDGFNKFNDLLFTFFSASKERHDRVNTLIKDAKELKDAINILKDHDHKKDLFTKGSINSICMMKSPLGDHTTGSLVFESNSLVLWTTASSTPFLSIFKPILIKDPDIDIFKDENKAHEYWLNKEIINRLIYSGFIDLKTHLGRINMLQDELISKYMKIDKNDIEQLNKLSLYAFKKEKEIYDSYDGIKKEYLDGHIKLIKPWNKYSKELK